MRRLLGRRLRRVLVGTRLLTAARLLLADAVRRRVLWRRWFNVLLLRLAVRRLGGCWKPGTYYAADRKWVIDDMMNTEVALVNY